MRLLSCYISGYGKIANESFDLSKDCTVICEDNGWGKSTLASFIKVMLFGFADEGKRDEAINERKKYTPWSGGAFGGTLRFAVNGQEYEAIREFRTKAKDDTFQLRDLRTNLESGDYSTKLGEELFGIDAATFYRTVYISQHDCETSSTDAINAKIGNLVDDTEDINNYERVNVKLGNIINRLTPLRKTGSLYRLKEEITNLQTQVRGRETAELSLEARKKNLIREKEKIKELQESKEENLAKHKVISEALDLQAKKQQYEEICNNYSDREKKKNFNRDFFPGEVPTKQEISNMIKRAASLATMYQQRGKDSFIASEEVELGRLEDLFSSEVPTDQELKEIKAQIKMYHEKRELLSRMELSSGEKEQLEQLDRLFKDKKDPRADFQQGISQCSIVKELINKKQTIEMLKDILPGGNDIVSATGASSSKGKSSVLILGILLSVLGLAGIFVNGVAGGILIVAGIIAIGIHVAQNKKKQEQCNAEIDSIDRQIVEINTLLEELLGRYGCEFRQEYIIEDLYSLKSKYEQYKKLDNQMQDTQVRECKEEVSALVCKLKEALSRYVNVETEANFNNILYEIESQKSRYVSLKEKQARFNSSNTEYNKVKREVIQFLESYRFHAQEDVQEQLVSIQDHLHSYLSSEEELINMKLKKKEFEASEDVNKLMNVLESNTMENIQSIEDQLENITNQLFNTNRNITHYENEIQDLQIKSDELDDKESLLRLRENEYITEMKRYENINKVKEYLEKAKISFAEKYMQPTLEAFKEYYELVTEEDSSLYRMDANYDVTCMGGIKQREARLLSSGYRDLIGICMRMSFVRCMYPNEKPCLIMDDPFVNLDEAKTQGAIELISQISQEYQVIYMTCHRSRV